MDYVDCYICFSCKLIVLTGAVYAVLTRAINPVAIVVVLHAHCVFIHMLFSLNFLLLE